MAPRSRAAALGASVVAVVACAQILNVDGIEIVEPAAGGSAGTGAGTAVRCSPGEFRCTGAALELCDSSENAFRTVRVCSSAELCCADPALCEQGQPGCAAPACVAGEYRCREDALELCNPGQTGFIEVDRCPSALHCNASQGRCTEQPCNAAGREQQCSGNRLEECLPGRNTWSLVNTCDTHGLCSPGEPCAAAACRVNGAASPPSPYICSDGNLMRCNDAQTAWEYVETCLNPANCLALINELAGNPYAPTMSTAQLERFGCAPPDCTPGRYRCDNADLMLCGVNRTLLLDRVDSCLSPRHCNASAGQCTPQPCTVGEHQCSGDEYQVCTATGWERVETCKTGAPCDADTGCGDTICRPNEYRCNGQGLERCNVARTDWIPVSICQTASLCNAATKRCEAPQCEPGARRCTSAGVLEGCNAEQTGWVLLDDCAAGSSATGRNRSALCDPSGAGRCLPSASCPAGALRCNGAELETCRDDSWHPYAHCTTPAQCDTASGTCRTPECEPGAFRCVTPAAPNEPAPKGASRLGLVLQVCNNFGTAYETVEACAGLELCDDVHGQCDICDPSSPTLCSLDRLLVCTADGQELTPYKTCTQGCIDAGMEGVNRTTCREDLENASTN